jgi:hypothetical protein
MENVNIFPFFELLDVFFRVLKAELDSLNPDPQHCFQQVTGRRFFHNTTAASMSTIKRRMLRERATVPVPVPTF